MDGGLEWRSAGCGFDFPFRLHDQGWMGRVLKWHGAVVGSIFWGYVAKSSLMTGLDWHSASCGLDFLWGNEAKSSWIVSLKWNWDVCFFAEPRDSLICDINQLV